MSANAPNIDGRKIVEEAVRLLRNEGFESMTLRRIADGLGIKAASLYWHFDSKERLLAAVLKSIFHEALSSMPETESWRDWLFQYGLSLSRMLREVPDTRKIIVIVRVDDEAQREGREYVKGILGGMGMPHDIADAAQESVQALITGWIHLRENQNPGQDDEVFALCLNTLLRGWEDVMAERGRHLPKGPVSP